LDIIVGAPLTERFLQVLEWSGKSQYLKAEKKVWKIDTDVAGYVRTVNNFHQVGWVYSFSEMKETAGVYSGTGLKSR
jgi:hypothetical protein